MVKHSIILILSKITKLIIRKYMYKFIRKNRSTHVERF